MRYGTPRAWRPRGFLASMVTRSVRSSVDSRYFRLSGLPYGLQRTLPSVRGGFTPRSRGSLRGVYRNLDRFAIALPSRVPLSPRLTLIRLTLFRKPWAFGAGGSLPRCRYSCLHLRFIPLHGPSRVPLQRRNQCSPTTPYTRHGVRSFGLALDARSSSTPLRSTSELLRTL